MEKKDGPLKKAYTVLKDKFTKTKKQPENKMTPTVNGIASIPLPRPTVVYVSNDHLSDHTGSAQSSRSSSHGSNHQADFEDGGENSGFDFEPYIAIWDFVIDLLKQGFDKCWENGFGLVPAMNFFGVAWDFFWDLFC